MLKTTRMGFNFNRKKGRGPPTVKNFAQPSIEKKKFLASRISNEGSPERKVKKDLHLQEDPRP